MTIAYSNILRSKFRLGEKVANCQSCGKEINVEEICEACASKNEPETSQAAPKTISKNVLAVIIVVAIVILASFAYYWTLPKEEVPTGYLASIDIRPDSTVKITFGTIQPLPDTLDCMFILTSASGTIINYTFNGPLVAATTELNATSGSAVFVDHYGASALTSGDHIIISGLVPGETYKFSIYYYQMDKFLKLEGDVTFQMPP